MDVDLAATRSTGNIRAFMRFAMNRRAFLSTLVTALCATPGAVTAQRSASVHRIGYLSGSAASPYTVEAFRQGLRDLGYVEGQDIAIEFRYADGAAERLAGLAAELVRLNVEVIIASPAPSVSAARRATATIPIVMIGAFDPVSQGIVASLARPGGNVTGLTYSVGKEIYGKQLALLKETVSEARRIGVLSNPANPAAESALTELQLASRSLGVELMPSGVRNPNEIASAFAALAKEHIDALIVVSDPMLTSNAKRVADLAVKSRLPAATTNRLAVEGGYLMSYGPSFSDLWRRAAGYVDKILKGAKPGDLPVEQPTKYEFVLNLKTAQALGVSIPAPLLLRADEVIQ